MTTPAATASNTADHDATPPLHVMSFNALFRTSSTTPEDPGHWARRAPAIEALLAAERPHLLGMQEMQEGTFGPVEAGLGRSYRRIGTATRGGSDGLINPILYDAERLELLGWNQFWLSDRPREIGSATWGNAGPRVAVWARFRDLATGGELVHLNTHLDHVITQAKVKGAQLIADHLLQFRYLHLPTITTGDFNSVAAASPAYTVLVEEFGLQDTWLAAERRTSPGWGTFPHFQDVEESEFRIDWILASQDVQVLDASINAMRPDGVFPSDHLPVQAQVRMPGAGSGSGG
ncbi:endonuclease/exonuclease/phosphatase family protein [Brachybacterium sp. AOP43-C2-M15]|uniref:endonuclease/exonuclease/phosphatase family protein n=1 Tax=Brachybacterium sp. AOP43-C2-M15 TaxID=3457661 RepID=UPI00403430FC